MEFVFHSYELVIIWAWIVVWYLIFIELICLGQIWRCLALLLFYVLAVYRFSLRVSPVFSRCFPIWIILSQLKTEPGVSSAALPYCCAHFLPGFGYFWFWLGTDDSVTAHLPDQSRTLYVFPVPVRRANPLWPTWGHNVPKYPYAVPHRRQSRDSIVVIAQSLRHCHFPFDFLLCLESCLDVVGLSFMQIEGESLIKRSHLGQLYTTSTEVWARKLEYFGGFDAFFGITKSLTYPAFSIFLRVCAFICSIHPIH